MEKPLESSGPAERLSEPSPGLVSLWTAPPLQVHRGSNNSSENLVISFIHSPYLTVIRQKSTAQRLWWPRDPWQTADVLTFDLRLGFVKRQLSLLFAQLFFEGIILQAQIKQRCVYGNNLCFHKQSCSWNYATVTFHAFCFTKCTKRKS